MLGIENFFVFLGAGVMLNLYPGPDTLYIIGRSVSQGRAAGVAAVLGITTGGMVHALLGAFGFSAILATSALAFQAIKYAGCLYLLYQALQMFRESTRTEAVVVEKRAKSGILSIYRQGAVTNILNPKVALFFLAFLPQFIDPAAVNKPFSFLLLGAVFMTTGTIWCLVVAFCAASFSSRLRGSGRVSRWLLRANGSLFAVLGLKLAITDVDFQ